jgi:hypothetical protein
MATRKAAAPAPVDAEKLAARLARQRSKIGKTVRLLGRQLTAHLAELAELAEARPAPKRPPARRLAEAEADRLIAEANRRV